MRRVVGLPRSIPNANRTQERHPTKSQCLAKFQFSHFLEPPTPSSAATPPPQPEVADLKKRVKVKKVLSKLFDY